MTLAKAQNFETKRGIRDRRIGGEAPDLGEEFPALIDPLWRHLFAGDRMSPAPNGRDPHLDEAKQVVRERCESDHAEVRRLEVAALSAKLAEISGAAAAKALGVDALLQGR